MYSYGFFFPTRIAEVIRKIFWHQKLNVRDCLILHVMTGVKRNLAVVFTARIISGLYK